MTSMMLSDNSSIFVEKLGAYSQGNFFDNRRTGNKNKSGEIQARLISVPYYINKSSCPHNSALHSSNIKHYSAAVDSFSGNICPHLYFITYIS